MSEVRESGTGEPSGTYAVTLEYRPDWPYKWHLHITKDDELVTVLKYSWYWWAALRGQHILTGYRRAARFNRKGVVAHA